MSTKTLKFRTVTLPSGHTFRVPPGIQRLDYASNHGWQVRYGFPTKLFSDFSKNGEGAAVSFGKAMKELKARMASLPAPNRLTSNVAENKTSDLPVGISGPIVRIRPGQVPQADLAVLLPRYGQRAVRRTIYIGNKNTYSAAKFEAALQKAIAMREEAVKIYEREVTAANKRAARTLLVESSKSPGSDPRSRERQVEAKP